VIIGAAFGKIVTSLVGDIIMPLVGLVLGKVDFTNLFLPLDGKHYETLLQAKEANAPVMTYGIFLQNVIDFLIIAFVIFLMVRQINRMRPAPPPPAKV
jgi:large conductance mechanosensitive channel